MTIEFITNLFFVSTTLTLDVSNFPISAGFLLIGNTTYDDIYGVLDLLNPSIAAAAATATATTTTTAAAADDDDDD